MSCSARTFVIPFTLGIFAACAPDAPSRTNNDGPAVSSSRPAPGPTPMSARGGAVRDGVSTVLNDAADDGGSVAASLVRIAHEGHRRYVVAFRDASDAAAGGYGIGFAFSDDDGASWTRGSITRPDRLDPHAASALGTPVLAVGPGEQDPPIYLAATARALDADVTVILAARSVDGGTTFRVPVRAVEPRLDQTLVNADSPSLAVDPVGILHLMFVSDRGTPDAQIRHWLGVPGPASCTFSCITWWPWIDIGGFQDPVIAESIAHPILRMRRNDVYAVFEIRRPLATPTPSADAEFRMVAAHLNPFTGLWQRMTEQPLDSRWIRYRAHTMANDSTAATDAGAPMDFVLDDAGRGRVVWTGTDDDEGELPPRVHVQPFTVVDTLSETWGDVVAIDGSSANAVALQPSASGIAGVASIAWLEQDLASGRVRWMGSFDAGEGFGAARNLTAIGANDPNAWMTVCPNSSSRWSDGAASVVDAEPNAAGGFVTVTVHAASTNPSCVTRGAGMTATRWTAFER